MKTLDQYIKVIPNVLSDDLCDAILQEYKSSDEWTPALVNYERVVDTSYRNVSLIPLSTAEVISRNREKRVYLDKQIFESAIKVVKLYEDSPYLNIQQDTGYDLLRYEVGCFFNTHVDTGNGVYRTLSCSFMLNEEYDGGMWEFFHGELKLKPPKGSAVVFPSNFLFPHAITPVTAGTRFSIVTWFN